MSGDGAGLTSWGDMQDFRSALVREDPVVLQHPGQHRVLRRWHVLGDLMGLGRLDARLFFDRRALAELTSKAEASATGRVVVHGAEIEIEEREDRQGNRYLVLAFTGKAVPEGNPFAVKS